MSKVWCALLCLCSFVSCAQNQFTLTGTIEVNTGEQFPYKIVFSESNGMVRGYSYTYKEPNDTKATIEGTLDRFARTLAFKEKEIVYSHDYHTKAYMCLLDARLEYVQLGKDKVLSGSINNTEADRTACTPGTVLFTSASEIQRLFASPEKFDTVITLKKKIKTPEPVKEEPVVPQEQAPAEKLTKGSEKAYEWHSDTVVVDIWDGGSADGDQVTLLYNGKPWLNRYTLVKQKKQLRIPVSKTGTDVLMLTADNEGAEPPNTASMMLADGDIHYNVIAYNNKGNAVLIKIKRAGSTNIR